MDGGGEFRWDDAPNREWEEESEIGDGKLVENPHDSEEDFMERWEWFYRVADNTKSLVTHQSLVAALVRHNWSLLGEKMRADDPNESEM